MLHIILKTSKKIIIRYQKSYVVQSFNSYGTALYKNSILFTSILDFFDFITLFNFKRVCF